MNYDIIHFHGLAALFYIEVMPSTSRFSAHHPLASASPALRCNDYPDFCAFISFTFIYIVLPYMQYKSKITFYLVLPLLAFHINKFIMYIFLCKTFLIR